MGEKGSQSRRLIAEDLLLISLASSAPNPRKVILTSYLGEGAEDVN